ncbi:hypothetical protein HCY65_14440 [Acinetobacter radioresistens]|jgi:hypothetical protein|nr:hypothetical protein [Acinetobacter radioresistens]MCK4097419.1 hypothetical protein [Acinetobacter radioresistens]MCK4100453.1 hypothetical protein [Acinetobacter radioresistens]MCK4112239.1 hypothetical protein [Acinetobacter radioresistens]
MSELMRVSGELQDSKYSLAVNGLASHTVPIESDTGSRPQSFMAIFKIAF